MTFSTRFERADDASVDDNTILIVDGKEVGGVQHLPDGAFVVCQYHYDAAGSLEAVTHFDEEYPSLALAVDAAKLRFGTGTLEEAPSPALEF
jgi:hypothetical protein